MAPGALLRRSRRLLLDQQRTQVATTVDRLAGLVGVPVDDPEFDRLLQIAPAPPTADHLFHLAGLAQGTGERTTDQPDTDDRQPTDQHQASTRPRASRKRAFSCGRPMVTRR